MVQFREGTSLRATDGKGLYELTWSDDPFGVDRGFGIDLTNAAATEAEVRAALLRRAAASTGLTDFDTGRLLNVDQQDLVSVKVPFAARNVTFGRPVSVAMVRRPSNTLLLGSGVDTLRVPIPADQWVPGDRLVLLEDVVQDSVSSAGVVLRPDGTPVRWTRTAVTFSRAILGCDTPRESCNPLRQGQRGATGYNPMRAGDRTRFHYYVGLGPADEYAFDVVAPVTGSLITTITDSALARIRVVPNPFLLYSRYQTSVGEPRLLFTHMPPRGTLRLYTVAGQLVQQITWVPADLEGDGDLFWNLRTLGGRLVASGLYLWVLTAPSNPSDPGSPTIRARGKFVVIQGSAM